VPQPGDVLIVHGGSGPLGEPVTRQGRDDNVKGGTVDVVGVWIGQEWHERKQLDERARPAMGQDQRNAVPVPGPLMDEMNVDAVEIGAELIGRVQLALLCVPIELVGPICNQLSKVIKVSPLLPGSAWCRIRPARLADALSEVRQDLWLDPDRERGDV
jgi:hypothetical protein